MTLRKTGNRHSAVPTSQSHEKRILQKTRHASRAPPGCNSNPRMCLQSVGEFALECSS
jgi:hypothetical protein